MKKNKPFPTIAEALEAGEPPLLDKITGEEKDFEKRGLMIVGYSKISTIERVFKTLSGRYIIIARQRTPEEETAKEKARRYWKQKEAEKEKARIAAAMALQGYILVAWRNVNDRFFKRDVNAYYLPISGARFVYSKQFKIVRRVDEQGMGYITIEPDKYPSLSRWSRKEIAERIKQEKDKCTLCAPLWLLTSIPDPRPRFLAGEE